MSLPSPGHLKRYKDIAGLFLKYGHSDLWAKFHSDLPGLSGPAAESAEPGKPEELARDLERLGPTYIKLGQLLSTQSAWIPEPYIRSLEELQDRVPPFPFEDAERIVEEELGGRIKKAFRAFDPVRWRDLTAGMVAEFRNLKAADVAVGRLFLNLAAISERAGVSPPPQFAMLGKTLLKLDRVAKALAPDFDPNRTVREYASELMRSRLLRTLSPGKVFHTALEANEFLQRLPGKLNSLLEMAVNNELRVRVETPAEGQMIAGLQKIANRITMGLVLAALIVGAALMMRVDTPFRLLGYPGLAVLLFLGACVGGVAQIYSILNGDRRYRRPV